MNGITASPVQINQTPSYTFQRVVITRFSDGGMVARIVFDVKDQNETSLLPVVIEYTGSEYNTFWENFNDGSFLYKELVRKLSLDAQVPVDIDQKFINP